MTLLPDGRAFDLMQPLGPIPSEPEADVGSVLRSTEERDGVGQQLRLGSLAHKDWPYTGTPWEWRGFKRTVTLSDTLRRWEQEADLKAEFESRYQKLNFGPELT